MPVAVARFEAERALEKHEQEVSDCVVRPVWILRRHRAVLGPDDAKWSFGSAESERDRQESDREPKQVSTIALPASFGATHSSHDLVHALHDAGSNLVAGLDFGRPPAHRCLRSDRALLAKNASTVVLMSPSPPPDPS